MEKLKNGDNSKSITFQRNDFNEVIRILLFSLIGIVIFFVPIKINNQFETVIYHLSYYIENKISSIIEISLIFFVMLSTLRDILNKEKSFFSNLSIFIRLLTLLILISFILGKEDFFIRDDKFLLVMRDLIYNLVILLPVSAIFMPFLLEYGLIEIVESYTNKIMKKTFKVSGKVFLNFLVYLLVDTVCGAFFTYRLYKDGKLREREACITILNFSVLSLPLTFDLCNKFNINRWKLILLEIVFLIICNVIISRIFPLKKKKQRYYVKAGYKDISCKRNRMKVAIKKRIIRGNNKNIMAYSMSYLNDLIYILMDLIPNIILVFFLGSIIFNTPFIIDKLNEILILIIKPLHLPNSDIISSISNISFFSNIIGIKVINEDIFYVTKIILSLIITLQGISISFLIPFINKTIFPLNAKEIIIVILERYAIILFLSSTIYYFYLNYII